MVLPLRQHDWPAALLQRQLHVAGDHLSARTIPGHSTVERLNRRVLLWHDKLGFAHDQLVFERARCCLGLGADSVTNRPQLECTNGMVAGSPSRSGRQPDYELRASRRQDTFWRL